MKNTGDVADIALTESGEATLTIYQSLVCVFDGGRGKSKAKKKIKI